MNGLICSYYILSSCLVSRDIRSCDNGFLESQLISRNFFLVLEKEGGVESIKLLLKPSYDLARYILRSFLHRIKLVL